MLTGIEIILERMKTHPEEFVDGGKYVRAVQRVRPYLTAEEIEALKMGIATAHRDYFNGEVMKIMSGEGESLLTEELSLSSTIEGDISKSFQNSVSRALFKGASGTTAPSAFGAVPMKAEGTTVSLF